MYGEDEDDKRIMTSDLIELDRYYKQRLLALRKIMRDDEGASGQEQSKGMIAISYIDDKLKSISKGAFSVHPSMIEGVESKTDGVWVEGRTFRKIQRKLRMIDEL